jgi:hypothetical protein
MTNEIWTQANPIELAEGFLGARAGFGKTPISGEVRNPYYAESNVEAIGCA